jgi:transposase InsO family protein
LERRIRRLRIGAGLGPGPIGHRLGLAPSTVHAVLVRLRLNRLSRLHRVTRQPVRYERARAGELLHLDTKKLGKIPPGGGKRFFWPGFAETKSGPHSHRGGGHDYLHVAVDDHSRVSYTEALADEGGATAAAFLERAIAAFRERGVTIKEILTDNAKAYVVSRDFQRVVVAHGLKHRRTQPYRPQTNGKAERFIQTLLAEWAYARPYTSNQARLRQLPRWLDYYNRRRPHGGIAGAVPASRL